VVLLLLTAELVVLHAATINATVVLEVERPRTEVAVAVAVAVVTPEVQVDSTTVQRVMAEAVDHSMEELTKLTPEALEQATDWLLFN
jgi:hypothetical protein